MKRLRKGEQNQSTRQLLGIRDLQPHGAAAAPAGSLVFFRIRPDNLSVLSAEAIRMRVTALGNLLRAEEAVEILAMDAQESFQRNQAFYQSRLEEEQVPAIQALLRRDMDHLDEIQAGSASSREFFLVLRTDEKSALDESSLRQREKALCDHGVPVRLAEEADVKRLLAVYCLRDAPTGGEEDVDGERAVMGRG